MNRFFTAGLLSALTLALTLMQAHAGERKQCNAQLASYLIGEHLTRELKERVRVEARATRVVVNPIPQEFEPNRLRIITDESLRITGMSCG
jgi:hypothetical protein